MRAHSFKTLTRVVMAAAMVAGLADVVEAIDGQVLINQNRALAGGVTPGDAPGFPVTLSEPGSYRLSSNLTVPDQNTTAVQITANNVSVDLNGFTILGPNVCIRMGSGVTACNASGSGMGIESLVSLRGAAISNGGIRGMGSDGIRVGNARVEAIRVESNGGFGIQLSGGEANDNVALLNGSDGVRMGGTGLATRNTAVLNGGSGLSGFGLFLANVAGSNSEWGLDLPTSSYQDNHLSGNGFGPVNGGLNMGNNACGGAMCP